jgi:hypothetical protein
VLVRVAVLVLVEVLVGVAVGVRRAHGTWLSTKRPSQPS